MAPDTALEPSPGGTRPADPYDAVLLYSFGGPDGPEDVMPFLRNVTAGKGIPDARLEERVAQTSDALKDEGIVDHWRRDDDGFHLMNTTCPYRKAAELTDAPCHVDHRTVELLVGAPVQQVSRMVDGYTMCEYVVQDRQANEDTRTAEDRALGAL